MNDEKLTLHPEESAESPYSQLTSSFGSAELSQESRFYNVNQSDALIKKLTAVLAESETGKRLLDLAEAKGVKIHLIKSKKLQSSTTPELQLYLAAEADQKEPQIAQVLELGGALREIEQTLMGYKLPPKDSDPLERASIAHTKFLDKIVYMCKIGIDLEITYKDEVQQAIEAYGFEDIYKAQVDALEDEEVKEIYIEATKKAKKD